LEISKFGKCLALVASFFVSSLVFAVNLQTNEYLKEYNEYLGENTFTKNIVEYNLTAATSLLAVAGKKSVSTWSYNLQIPGPILRVKQGDNVKINFTNTLPVKTTIHWHGMRVPNAMDGVPIVTQKPVMPGASFTYEFGLVDAGTYWFHPHVRSHEQVEKGLYGVFIVESNEDPEYDDEIVLVLDDWLLNDEGQIEDSFDINGGDLNAEGRLGNVITVNGKPLPTFDVKAGARIRLRVINASNARNYRFKIPSAEAVIFAVDGNLSGRTLALNEINIAPGNRVDIDIKIPHSKEGNSIEGTIFDIKNTFFHREARGNILKGPQVLAKLRIKGSVDIVKDFPVPLADNVPKWSGALKTPINETFSFDTKLDFGAFFSGGPLVSFVINGKKYGEHIPTKMALNQFQHYRITNGTGLYHPIHFHGMFFKVLSRDGKKVDEPFFRDTALLDYDGSLEIGVIAKDPGSWMMHCHLLEHSALGMMTLIEVK